MKKYEDILVDLGLSPNEAKIYKTLLELKKGSIWNISSHAQIHRRNTYDAIKRLVDRGLAYQVLPKKFLTYAPVHPEKLRELIEEKISGLEAYLPFLVKKFTQINQPHSIYIYKGIAGLKNYINLEIETGKTIYGIGSKGSWFDPKISLFARKASVKFKNKRIKTKIIYDEEVKNHPEIIKSIGSEYKFLPSKYSSKTSLEIFGDYVAIYSGMGIKELEEDITIFILKDKTLAKDCLKWFEFIWDNLPKNKHLNFIGSR